MKPKAIKEFITNPGNGRNYALITASKGKPTDAENNRQLERDLEKLNAGKMKTEGVSQKWGSESSLFVTNISLPNTVKLGKKYDQDAVIYNGKGYTIDKDSISRIEKEFEYDSKNASFGKEALKEYDYTKFVKKGSKREPFALKEKS